MTPALTIEEAAEALNVGVYTMRNLVKRGQITHAHAGRRIRISRAAIDAYLAGEPCAQTCVTCQPNVVAAHRSAS